MLSKEILNENRILLMSTNRKLDYLLVDTDFRMKETTIIGITHAMSSKEIKDIVFIKTIAMNDNIKLKNIAEYIENLCIEFGHPTILIDSMGLGLGMYDTLKAMNLDIQIIPIKCTSTLQSEAICLFYNNVHESKLRFLQTEKNAKNSYRHSFLGYSEIINSHKETDNLINEIADIELESNKNNIVRLKKTNDNINTTRFYCLLLLYLYYHDNK